MSLAGKKILVPIGATAAGLAILVFVLWASRAKVSGHFESRSGPHGAWSWDPDSCASGAHSGFFGVDLMRGDFHRIRVVRDPVSGDEVKVFASDQDEQGVLLTAKQCATLRLEVGENGSRLNHVAGLRGSLTLVCADPGAGSVRGTATFDDCF